MVKVRHVSKNPTPYFAVYSGFLHLWFSVGMVTSTSEKLVHPMWINIFEVYGIVRYVCKQYRKIKLPGAAANGTGKANQTQTDACIRFHFIADLLGLLGFKTFRFSDFVTDQIFVLTQQLWW